MKKLTKIWIIMIALVCVALLTMGASTQIHDFYIEMFGGGIVINQTGFYGNGSKISKAYDLVIDVYDGTNPDCYTNADVCCDDGECSDEINSCAGYSCFIKGGTYQFTSDITIDSNTKLIGDNNVIFNFSSSMSLTADGTKSIANVLIENINFTGQLPNTQDTAMIDIPHMEGINNLIFRNLNFEYWNHTFTINITSDEYKEINHIIFENIQMLDCRGGIKVMEEGQRIGYVKNVKLEGMHFTNPTQYEGYYDLTSWGFIVHGGENIEVYNTYWEKAADGQSVVLRRTVNGKIINIKTKRQHDYPVDIADGCKNIYVDNVFAEDPRGWGLAFINQQNFVEDMENIKLTNLYVPNGSNSSTSQPSIWIRHNKAGGVMRNIEISNFYINKSGSQGAIEIEAEDGEIDGLKITNGFIENTNRAGIRFVDSYLVQNVIIDGVTFKNMGQSVTDSSQQSGILFLYANTRNVKISNNLFYNDTNTMLYSIATYSINGGDIDFEAENNRQVNTSYRFTGTGHRAVIDDYAYPSLANINCSTNFITNGKTVTNYTGTTYNRCTCIDNSWRCINFD